MLETRIKICGITSPTDAGFCLSAGADYLGLIFAPSSRQVSPDIAKAIRAEVPQAMLVGVFADAPLEEVIDAGRSCRLNMIQLHGSESPAYCDQLLRSLSLPIIKTISVRNLADLDRMREYTRTSYFLFDLDKDRDPAALNGAREHLWSEAARVRRIGYRIFLAGALDVGNVRDAVRTVRPYGIDVATGVERGPGVKDSMRVVRLIQEVRQ